MNCMRLVLMLALAVGAFGCGDDDGGTPDMTTGDMTVGDDMTVGGGETYEYVVNVIAVPSPSASSEIAGFNLDGMVSDGNSEAGCGQPDFTGTDGTMGVDNVLGSLRSLLDTALMGDGVNGSLAAAITEGRAILLTRLTDVNDLTNDDSAMISMFFATRAAGSEPMVDGTGLVSAGQTFDFMMQVVPPTAATISGGIVNATAASLPLSIPTDTGAINLTLTNASLKFAVSATTMTDGVIGGQIELNDIYTIAAGLLGGEGSACTMDSDCTVSGEVCRADKCLTGMISILETTADLISDSSCTPTAEDNCCDAISAGLEFAGVEATIGSMQ